MGSFRPTLRLVISVTTSSVVLVVAAVALAITYTVSLSTVRDVGRGYATALAATARVDTQNYFQRTSDTLDSLSLLLQQNSSVFDLPSALPLEVQNDPLSAERYYYSMFMASRATNYTYTTLAFIFDDGSGVSFYRWSEDIVAFVSRMRYNWPQGNMSIVEKHLYVANSTETFTGLDQAAHHVDIDARFSAYSSGKVIAGANPKGMWYAPQMTDLAGNIAFSVPAVKPLYNTSNQFVGFVLAAQPFTAISEFLMNVKVTSGTEAFAVMFDGSVIGSTHATPYFTIQPASASAPVRTGCASTADTRYDHTRQVFHGCRVLARHFSAYPPLQAAAEDDAFLFSKAAVQVVDAGGERYFVASTAVPNSYRFWGVNVILCMPESDVIGNIVTGRNIAIGVTIAAIVLAAVLSFVIIHVLLQPLADISGRMLDTAKLHDRDQQDIHESALAEIQDLQRAYAQMNTAIRSFTRYVPRDVVKDLLATGQLCSITMTPLPCTILFTDIQGFTSVCERLSPMTLSSLVSAYFERASRIILSHDGQVDKFIGDCVMAVWGAPFAVAHAEVKAVLAGKLLDRDTVVAPLANMWQNAGEELRVRVGISTGEVLAGNMGCAERMNYTVIGDSVNTASRLESLNKQFDTRVLISESTAEALHDLFVLRLLMPIAVVGKDRPVKVYEVLGLHPNKQRTAVLDDGDTRPTLSDHDELGTSFVMSRSFNDSAPKYFRRSTRNVSRMLADAIQDTAGSDVPLECANDQVLFSERHSEAVNAYLYRNFPGCLAMLDALVEQTPAAVLHGALHMGTSSSAVRSVQIIRDLCVKYISEGCPENFDGVYHALTK
eukprot:CAMPEP_0174842496 /NCGR_PEP_ID=MMETSP1114-20130205/9947_1 /TAXON_ID=312471 /ORGANISM="Neobodo designis, Strain CCAP 1951/1" /LENGTH=831 /DNA_ID=CAMNT_0016076701 /DNA_START=43 /DNA_END=2538 /DNA_ORIENTATION=+